MVMPLYDDNPFKLPHRPIVTWGLIVANLVLFVAEFSASAGPETIVRTYGLIPDALIGEISVAGALSPVLTLFSYQFLHADLTHLLGNMIFLWVFGDDIEECLGRLRYLGFYLASGVIGGLVYVWSDVHSSGPLIGASGSIAGVVIAYVMLRPCAKITVLTFGIIPMRISAYWVVGVFVVMQFINLESSSKSEVAYWCHIGGMLAGAALFPLMRPAGVVLFECIRPPKVPVVVAGTDQVAEPGPWGPR
jgi:membrane associated rhomboid family serine protease